MTLMTSFAKHQYLTSFAKHQYLIINDLELKSAYDEITKRNRNDATFDLV